MELNCLYTYNAAICLRKAIATVVENSRNLLNIPLDKYYIAFCEDFKIIDKSSLCCSCEGCLDFLFLTTIWFKYIEALEKIYNDDIIFVDSLLDKFKVPDEQWEKYYFIMSLSEQKDFILKNYSDVDKDSLEKVSASAKNAYLNLCQAYYNNLISDCIDKVFRLFDVLNERNLEYLDIELDGKTVVYFDTNVFSQYVSNRNFSSLVDLSKSKQYTYVYSPYILEDSIKSDRIHLLHDCNKLVDLTDNKTILPIDDKFSIKKENVFDCVRRVHLFRDFTQAQEEKNVYRKKLYELTLLPMPHKEQNIEKLNADFFNFFQNEVAQDDELKKYFASILSYANCSLSISEIVARRMKYSKFSSTIDELFQFFDLIGYASDTKEKTLKSAVQDLEHIKCATAADIFVTSDEKLYKRTCVLYILLGVKTEIMMINDFKQLIAPKRG